jgi:hypothetical protein
VRIAVGERYENYQKFLLDYNCTSIGFHCRRLPKYLGLNDAKRTNQPEIPL